MVSSTKALVVSGALNGKCPAFCSIFSNFVDFVVLSGKYNLNFEMHVADPLALVIDALHLPNPLKQWICRFPQHYWNQRWQNRSAIGGMGGTWTDESISTWFLPESNLKMTAHLLITTSRRVMLKFHLYILVPYF